MWALAALGLSLAAAACIVIVVVYACSHMVMPLSLHFDTVPLGNTQSVLSKPTPKPQDGGIVINSIFDYIMDNIRDNLGTLGRYQAVPIPDLEQSVEMATTSVTGTLRARRGILGDLTSLRRAGDLALRTEDGVLYVSGAIALRSLSATFRYYSLRAAMLKKSGDLLDLKVGRNAFDILLSIRFEGLDCDVRLERISVSRFSDVSVDMTGFSVFNPVTCKVAQWIVQSFQGFIKDVVERYAKDMVNAAVKDRELVGRLMGYGMEGMVRAHLRRGERGSADAAGCKCNGIGVSITVKPCSCCSHALGLRTTQLTE